ncbi:hypothetical protein V1478_009832 [Vespula squamosa]|uniref:Uncharacterized protein n=1 Tax=Vespula squamosa TaxID=30214 RepID=A0ABD2AK59_VESSQ
MREREASKPGVLSPMRESGQAKAKAERKVLSARSYLSLSVVALASGHDQSEIRSYERRNVVIRTRLCSQSPASPLSTTKRVRVREEVERRERGKGEREEGDCVGNPVYVEVIINVTTLQQHKREQAFLSGIIELSVSITIKRIRRRLKNNYRNNPARRNKTPNACDSFSGASRPCRPGSLPASVASWPSTDTHERGKTLFSNYRMTKKHYDFVVVQSSVKFSNVLCHGQGKLTLRGFVLGGVSREVEDDIEKRTRNEKEEQRRRPGEHCQAIIVNIFHDDERSWRVDVRNRRQSSSVSLVSSVSKPLIRNRKCYYTTHSIEFSETKRIIRKETTIGNNSLGKSNGEMSVDIGRRIFSEQRRDKKSNTNKNSDTFLLIDLTKLIQIYCNINNLLEIKSPHFHKKCNVVQPRNVRTKKKEERVEKGGGGGGGGRGW